MNDQHVARSTETPKRNKKQTIVAVAMTIVAVGLIAGVYLWQHNKAVQSNNEAVAAKSENQKLNASIVTLQKKSSSLQDQYNQAKATLDSYQSAANKNSTAQIVVTQSDLSLTINGAQYVNPAGTVTAGGKWFGVNVTLANNTSKTVSVLSSNFHLRDAQGNEYPEATIVGGESTLPSGWVGLSSSTLAPGETMKGTVEFRMSDETAKSFNFINVSKAFPVTSSN